MAIPKERGVTMTIREVLEKLGFKFIDLTQTHRFNMGSTINEPEYKAILDQAEKEIEEIKDKEKHLITLGYYKGEMDFGVNCSIGDLSLEELKKLREMIIVVIWCAEDMWRRNHKAIGGETIKQSQKG